MHHIPVEWFPESLSSAVTRYDGKMTCFHLCVHSKEARFPRVISAVDRECLEVATANQGARLISSSILSSIIVSRTLPLNN